MLRYQNPELGEPRSSVIRPKHAWPSPGEKQCVDDAGQQKSLPLTAEGDTVSSVQGCVLCKYPWNGILQVPLERHSRTRALNTSALQGAQKLKTPTENGLLTFVPPNFPSLKSVTLPLCTLRRTHSHTTKPRTLSGSFLSIDFVTTRVCLRMVSNSLVLGKCFWIR